MKKGFTLVELLIVVIIIGILATMALPQYQKMVNRARWAEAMQLAGAIKTAAVLYHAENGVYSTGDLATLSYLDIPAANDRRTTFSIATTNMIYAASKARQAADNFDGATATIPLFSLNITSNATLWHNEAPSEF